MMAVLVATAPYVVFAASACVLSWVIGYIVGSQHMREKMLDRARIVRDK